MWGGSKRAVQLLKKTHRITEKDVWMPLVRVGKLDASNPALEISLKPCVSVVEVIIGYVVVPRFVVQPWSFHPSSLFVQSHYCDNLASPNQHQHHDAKIVALLLVDCRLDLHQRLCQSSWA